MATVAQTSANRANARKSTGPRTEQGKAIVAQNAVKHGLLAQGGVIPGEDPGELEFFRDRMRDDLGPRGTLEGILADRVVNLAWRLRRAERLETAALAMLEDQHAARTTDKPAGDDPNEREAALARVIVEDFRYGKVLDQLLGYERRIENSLYRTVNELRKQRLIREVSEEVSEEVSSLKCEVSSEQSQLPGAPSLPTENFALQTPGEPGQTKPIGVSSCRGEVSSEEGEESNRPGLAIEHFTLQTAAEVACGVTTNGGESEEEFCQTKPNGVSSVKFEVSSEESPAASPSGLPTENVALQTADTSCETKPEEVSSGKWEVSSEQSQSEDPSSPPTENLTLQTANGACQVTSQPG